MKRLTIPLLISLVTALVHAWVYSTTVGERIEYFLLDTWFTVRGPIQAPGDIGVVAIDEESYTNLKVSRNQIWPRKLHADLVNRLYDMGAKRLVFDVLFFDESADKSIDQQLAAAFTRGETVIGIDVSGRSGVGTQLVMDFASVQTPLQTLADAASQLAFVTTPERFGYVRNFFTGQGLLTDGFPSLAKAAAGMAWNDPNSPGSRDLIDFYGPAGTIDTLSIDDVLTASAKNIKSKVAGKTLFIGLKLKTDFGAAQKDSYLTPYSEKGRVFGVEIHATAAGNLAERRWIRRFSEAGELLSLTISALVLGTVLIVLRPDSALALTLGAFATWAGVSYWGFLNGIFIPGIALFGVLLPSMYTFSTLYYYFTTRKAQLQTKRAFEHYISPEMAELVAKDPTALELGGEGAYATAFFTDIQGFTGITERMRPDEVAEMLNSYFTEVMEVIFPLRGTLIKFIGDAVFALWGAPIKVPDHAEKACQAALAVQVEIQKFNATGRFPPLKTRIGIHTGNMVVGNLGSKRRFDFTAIGDTVNITSRIEGLNKYLGTDILISDVTAKELKANLFVLPVGKVHVLGKEASIELLTLLPAPLPAELVERWKRALRAFRLRNWSDARTGFETIAEQSTVLVTAAELYLKEISRYERDAPPEDWEGTLSFGTK